MSEAGSEVVPNSNMGLFEDIRSLRLLAILKKRRGQFFKSFTSVIYKCNCCFQTLKQWVYIQVTGVKVLLN